jgi:hypothetical protein
VWVLFFGARRRRRRRSQRVAVANQAVETLLPWTLFQELQLSTISNGSLFFFFLMRVCDSVCVGWIFREFEVEKFVEAGGETTTSL